MTGYPGDNQVHVIPDKCDFKCVAKQIAQIHRDDKQIEDSYQIFDLSDILRKWGIWKRFMPNIEPHYAVKCNDHPFMLRALAGLGAGFDCASEMEMKMVLDIIGKEQKDRIIFAQPCKQNSHLEFAKTNGIEKMTFDCAHELDKIKKLYPDAKPLIRIKEDDTSASSPLGAKFGAHINEVIPLLKKAKELELDVVGVAFHVGSGAADARIFTKALQDAKWVFVQAKKLEFKNFKILDIGGGFPALANKVEEHLFEHISHRVKKAMDYYFPPKMGVTVYSEPGRFFAGTAFASVGFIHTVKEKEIPHEGKKKYMYYINDGVYGSFNNIMYDHQKPVPELLREVAKDEEEFETSIWGPTCDSLDRILPPANVCSNGENEDYGLLAKCEPGDWLLYRAMGAYTLVASENFNGFPKPELYNVCSETAWKTFREFFEEKTFNMQNYLGF